VHPPHPARRFLSAATALTRSAASPAPPPDPAGDASAAPPRAWLGGSHPGAACEPPGPSKAPWTARAMARVDARQRRSARSGVRARHNRRQTARRRGSRITPSSDTGMSPVATARRSPPDAQTDPLPDRRDTAFGPADRDDAQEPSAGVVDRQARGLEQTDARLLLDRSLDPAAEGAVRRLGAS
jgi:hypothetical protein